MKRLLLTFFLFVSACAEEPANELFDEYETAPEIDASEEALLTSKVRKTKGFKIPKGSPGLDPTLADLRKGPYLVAVENPSHNMEALVRYSVWMINTDAGFEIFRVVEPAKANAIVRPAYDATLGLANRGHFTGSCDVWLNHQVSFNLIYTPFNHADPITTRHELLHCLGFGHDINPDSLMFPFRLPEYNQYITPQIYDLLRQMRR